MKPPLALIVTCLVSALSAGEPANEWQGKKVPSLILASGKTYTGVTFTRIEPDAVTITHAGGVLRIPMESLKPEAQTALGYDPAKAAEARKQFQMQQATITTSNAQRVATEQAAMADKAAADEFAAASLRISAKITQVTDEGVLAKITILNSGGGGTEGDDIEFVEFDTRESSLVDGDRINLNAVPMREPFQYESVLGAAKTVRRWVLIKE
jgi:hypothetical protein